MTIEFDTGFRVSSYCQNGSCVQIALRPDGHVAMRDSKNTELPALVYTPAEWAAFVLGVKAGEFDIDPTVPGWATLMLRARP